MIAGVIYNPATDEMFIAEKVREGASVDGLFPIGDGWRAAYEEWKASR